MRYPLIAAVVMASGCMLGATQQREETLVRAARLFNDDLRWGRYEQMTASMLPEEARAFGQRVALVRDELVIADFEVTAVNFAHGSDKATVTVSLDWYTKREQTVKSTTLEERWEHRTGGWKMVKQRRARGDRFPLTPEPVAPSEATP